MKPTDEEKKTVTIDDYIIPEKIKAFVERYKPTDKQTQTCEVFTDARLRDFFKAVPTPVGDSLKEYINLLSCYGYQMHVSIQGEPAIFVEEKF